MPPAAPAHRRQQPHLAIALLLAAVLGRGLLGICRARPVLAGAAPEGAAAAGGARGRAAAARRPARIGGRADGCQCTCCCFGSQSVCEPLQPAPPPHRDLSELELLERLLEDVPLLLRLREERLGLRDPLLLEPLPLRAITGPDHTTALKTRVS